MAPCWGRWRQPLKEGFGVQAGLCPKWHFGIRGAVPGLAGHGGAPADLAGGGLGVLLSAAATGGAKTSS